MIGTFNYRLIPPAAIDAVLSRHQVEWRSHGSRVYAIEVPQEAASAAKRLLGESGFSKGLTLYP